jgi:hypothetical protein
VQQHAGPTNVLDAATARAMALKDENDTTAHPSQVRESFLFCFACSLLIRMNEQVDGDEGAEDRLPTWRVAQIAALRKEKQELATARIARDQARAAKATAATAPADAKQTLPPLTHREKREQQRAAVCFCCLVLWRLSLSFT